MHIRYTPLLLTVALITSASAQTIWNGPPITFTKAPFADHTLPQNQDQIAAGISITRADTEGLFNIAVENGYTEVQSPTGTEWAVGTTANLGSLIFADWETTLNADPPSAINVPLVLHLIADDIYVDLTFLQWSIGIGGGGTGGGGFSYQRSTDNTTSISENSGADAFTVFPNPASTGVLTIRPSIATSTITAIHVFDVIGNRVGTTRLGASSGSMTFDVSGLQEGVYLVQMDQGSIRHTQRVVITR